MSHHRSEFFDVVVAAVLYERLWRMKIIEIAVE
jgi:hypothetical protein